MFKRVHKAKLWWTASRKCELPRRFAAVLAVLGLYAQLAAAGLCSCDLPRAPGPNAFPICHTQTHSAATKQAQNDHAPAHQHPCSFCTAHCHAAMAAAPPAASLDSIVYVATARVEPAPFVIPQPARFSLGASPRGPPSLI